MQPQAVVESMCRSGLLPVFRTKDVDPILPATKAFVDAGVTCVEYTTTMPRALELVSEARAYFPDEVAIGLGTVLSGHDVERAVSAGATFIASPGLSEEMVAACKKANVASVAGIMTPTEIIQALGLGADVLKVFPADAVGPDFFADVLGPFPDVRLMAASKGALPNYESFIRAGAEIITVLGNGLDAAAYASGDFAAITRAAEHWVGAIREAKEKKRTQSA